MAKILPITEAASSTFSVNLGGSVYIISIKWKDRTSSWYCSITTNAGEEIIGDEKLSPRQMVVLYNLDKFQDGNLFVIPTINDNLEPLGRNNFGIGKKYEAIYASNAEIAEVIGGA